MTRKRIALLGLALGILNPAMMSFGWPDMAAAQTAGSVTQPNGQQLFRSSCAGCHGPDGKGLAQVQLGFETPLPDLTDCNFASREPDADWFAIIHDGGPVRGFDRMMPSFGGALSEDEIMAILGHIRTLCGDGTWPRGELNLPRAMFTEKAYPEDEAVLTTGVEADGPASIENVFIYEKRFGSRNQVELVIPFGFQEGEDGSWAGGLGDLALGFKRVIFHSAASGSILSVAGEVGLPTGNADEGFGSGVTLFEPFVTFGQVLPRDAFVQLQAGTEFAADRSRAEPEAFWRGAAGKTFVEGRFGRSWTPMVEILGARELESGAATEWDIVPQIQVSLNTRQHVLASVAARVPLTESSVRSTQILVYVLLDWFDGGFFDGW